MRVAAPLRRLALGTAVLTILTIAAAGQANDWPHWRGPELNGISREQNLPTNWSLEERENILWVSPIGGRATPIIMNGKLYLDCRTPHNTIHGGQLVHAGEQVVCLDADTGDLLWRDRFAVYNTDIPSPRVGWASMTGDPETGNVYVHSVSGTFRCYSGDGDLLWQISGEEDFGEITGFGGRIATPLIDEDRVILAFSCLNWGKTAQPPPKHTFYAFDKRTGELFWTAAPGGALQDTFQSSPIVATIDGVRQLISAGGDGWVYGMKARTGETLWKMKLSKRGLQNTVVVSGNSVYATHGKEDIIGTKFGRIQCIDATQRGDLTGTGGVWKVHGIKVGFSSPVVAEGVLYVITGAGTLVALDALDGTVLWKHPIGTIGKSSPVWAEGRLYVTGVNGLIEIIEVSREGAETISSVQLESLGDYSGKDRIYASPAIANGRIYIVTRDRTICIADTSRVPKTAPFPATQAENEPTGEIAAINAHPYEINVRAGETIDYEVTAFDKYGNILKTIDEFQIIPGEGLKGGQVKGTIFTTAADVSLPQAGVVTIKAAGFTDTVRVRSWPPLPWKFDFEGLTGKEVPAGWVGGYLKLKPVEMDGNTVMKSHPGKSRPSFYCWIGPSTMSEYVIQADVMTEGDLRVSNIGLMNHRYNLILKGNRGQLGVQTWAAHQRLRKGIPLEGDPAGKWYTMKFAVNVKEGKTYLKGKMWPRGESEPEEWTIKQVDPQVIDHGSPGLFTYRLSDAYFDNVVVSDLK